MKVFTGKKENDCMKIEIATHSLSIKGKSSLIHLG